MVNKACIVFYKSALLFEQRLTWFNWKGCEWQLRFFGLTYAFCSTIIGSLNPLLKLSLIKSIILSVIVSNHAIVTFLQIMCLPVEFLNAKKLAMQILSTLIVRQHDIAPTGEVLAHFYRLLHTTIVHEKGVSLFCDASLASLHFLHILIDWVLNH